MERPFTSLNMASSIDGKTTTFQREKVRFASDEDRELMEDLRSRTDAILIGAGTLATDDPPLILRIPRFAKQRRALGKRPDNPINIVVSSRLDFPIEESDFFGCSATDKIVFTTTSASSDKVNRLKKYSEVVRVPPDEGGKVDLRRMCRIMLDFNIRHLMLEGGGALNAEMITRKLIDEVYLTICPFVIAGQASPTTFDGEGFEKESVIKLDLEDCRRGSGGELFLKYSVRNSHVVKVEPSRMFSRGFTIH